MSDSVTLAEPPGTTAEPGYERVLGHRVGAQAGPTLICIAGLHGNEPAGIHGAQQVLSVLDERLDNLRGTFLTLVGNRPALAAGKRFLSVDLNRSWQAARLERLRAGGPPEHAEELEMRDLDRELAAAIHGTAGAVYMLDLHTTSAPGPPFVVLNDTLPNRAFALRFPVPVVLGLEEELGGTLLGYLAGHTEVISVGFESGQHRDPQSGDLAAAAVWLALETAGLVDAGDHPEIAAAHRTLAAAGDGLPHVVDVHHRHHIEPEDVFRMLDGFAGFQPIREGQLLAHDRQGAVTTPIEGLILMPLYQGLGDDGFFVVREVRPFWLRLSALVRRCHLEGLVSWLPGVRRHDTIPDAVVVDRQVARYLAVEFFHLLGYSRVGDVDGRYLTVRRRAYDR